MNKFIVGTFVFLSCALCGSAQLNSEVLLEARQARLEIVKEQRAERKAQEQNGKRETRSLSAAASVVGDAEVGESSSFNRNAKFFGTATAGFVILDSVCDPVALELGPDDRCLVVDPSAPATVTGTFNDIGRITLPGRQADNVIYLIANHSTSAVLQNVTASPLNAFIGYTPSITIESDALNDPAALNPDGTPMNGRYTTTGLGTKSIQRSLAPSMVDVENMSYSRANTNGLSRTFWAAIGLPNSVIDQLYRKPMTIRLNVTIRARRVESGVFVFSTRLLAN